MQRIQSDFFFSVSKIRKRGFSQTLFVTSSTLQTVQNSRRYYLKYRYLRPPFGPVPPPYFFEFEAKLIPPHGPVPPPIKNTKVQFSPLPFFLAKE